MSLLQRRWASAGPERSGLEKRGGWTSGRGVSTRAWWGTPRQKGPPGRVGPPAVGRRRRRRRQYPGVTTTQCCRVISGRLSARQLTGRGESVSSQMTNAQKPGDRLQRSSGKSTRTCVSPPWKIPCVQPSMNISSCRKRYPLTYQRMMSRGLYQSSPAQ